MPRLDRLGRRRVSDAARDGREKGKLLCGESSSRGPYHTERISDFPLCKLSNTDSSDSFLDFFLG